MADQATAANLDFTNVKDGGSIFNKKRQPEGDYKAKVLKVEDAPTKADKSPQWLFTIQVGNGIYPYYCKLEENQYWKVRNLLVAAGINVPKKRVKVDPNKVVGRSIAVTLQDAEYDGKTQSEIAATFPVSELDEDGIPDQSDDDDDDEDETPPPAKKKTPAPVEDDDEDEEDSDPLAGLDRSELKSLIASKKLDVKVFKSMTDDDIRTAIRALDEAEPEEDDEEEPAPPPKKKKAPVVEDDDLEEIDIDDT